MASSANSSGSGGGDVRSPSLSSDEQNSEASLIAETSGGGGTPLPPDTPDNLALAVLDSVAGKRFSHCSGKTPPLCRQWEERLMESNQI